MFNALVVNVVYFDDIVCDVRVEIILICHNAQCVQVVSINLGNNRLVEGCVMIVLPDQNSQVGVM